MPKTFERFSLPVVDAKDPLIIPLLQVDVDEGFKPDDDPNARKNFLGCVIAHAVTRVAGTHRVAILRRVAYVAYPGEKITRRYLLDSHSRRVVEAWDRGEEVSDGVQIRLLPPNERNTLEAMKQSQRALAKKRPLDRGTRSKRPKRGKPFDGIVRNGNLIKIGEI